MTKFSPVVKPVCTLDNETMRFATTCGALKLLKKKSKRKHFDNVTHHNSYCHCPLSPGGAGGKGVWGRSGEVYEPEAVDERDPNYDEDQVIVVLTSPGLLLLLLTQALLQM